LKPTPLQRGSQNLGRRENLRPSLLENKPRPTPIVRPKVCKKWRQSGIDRVRFTGMSFPITCTACHKTFTISDEIYEKKVAGRVVTIKCKSCNQGIRIDGTKGSSPSAAAPQPAPAAPAAAPEEPLWAVDYPDGQDREFTTAEVIAELERGAIGGATLVWRDGMAEWLELSQVPELAGDLARLEAKKKAEAARAAAAEAAKAAAAKAAAAKAAAKAAPVHKPRAPMATAVGLAGLSETPKPKATQPSSPELVTPPRATQPSGSDLATPRAAQASSPELLQPRAAQTSSPELFKPRAAQTSSPELLEPRSASAPVVPKPPVSPAMAPPPAPLPLPMGAPPPPPTPANPFAVAPSLPLPPQELPTPPLPASVAKVVSRPPNQQPAFPAASPTPMAASFATGPALVSDHATVEWPQAKSKVPLIVGLLVAVVVIIGLVLLLRGSDPPPPPSTPISALPAAPSPGSMSPTGSPTRAAQPGSDTATGSDPVVAAPDPGATPGAGFAELFAAGARKAESKGATVAPTARFDAAATKAPLAEAAAQAQACKQSGGPTGKVTVVVTFDPSGKVSGASITDAPFAGTPTATCISAALKRATIAPFSGLPGTVSKTFSIL
jgi:hypothetical protein